MTIWELADLAEAETRNWPGWKLRAADRALVSQSVPTSNRGTTGIAPKPDYSRDMDDLSTEPNRKLLHFASVLFRQAEELATLAAKTSDDTLRAGYLAEAKRILDLADYTRGLL